MRRVKNSYLLGTTLLALSTVTLSIYWDSPASARGPRMEPWGFTSVQRGLAAARFVVTNVSNSQPNSQSKARRAADDRARTKTEQSQPQSWTAQVKELLSPILSWPVTVLVLFLILVISKNASRRIAALFGPFRSIRLFGAEFVLSEEVARNAAEAIEVYRKQAKREYDRRIEMYGLRDTLENVVELNVMPALGGMQKVQDFRCTIHVPDILFAETLYQLLDYYPRGGGRGRTWSFRFGIVGTAWRSGNDQIQGRIPTDPRKLVSEWGMTREEAMAAGQGRQSFACVVLRDKEGTAVGVFYMDSTKADAFGVEKPSQTQLVEAVRKGSENRGLTTDLAKLSQELRSRGPLIRIYE